MEEIWWNNDSSSSNSATHTGQLHHYNGFANPRDPPYNVTESFSMRKRQMVRTDLCVITASVMERRMQAAGWWWPPHCTDRATISSRLSFPHRGRGAEEQVGWGREQFWSGLCFSILIRHKGIVLIRHKGMGSVTPLRRLSPCCQGWGHKTFYKVKP